MGEQGAEEFFGVSVLVDVGGVDEGAACGVEGGQLVGCFVGVDVEAPGHGAECEPGDAEAAAAELSLFHGVAGYALRGAWVVRSARRVRYGVVWITCVVVCRAVGCAG